MELFIGAGEETPLDYYEFEISPNGILFDAKVHSPHGDRTDLRAGRGLGRTQPALAWRAQRQRTLVRLRRSLPWMARLRLP
ncbi:MAG: hypothetical protein R2856_25260 [Caldilineaceae bacterium]